MDQDFTIVTLKDTKNFNQKDYKTSHKIETINGIQYKLYLPIDDNFKSHDLVLLKTSFQLYDLVCRSLITKNLEDLLINMSVNKICHRFSNNLIKVAAKHIFVNPIQSITEIVSNAIDSNPNIPEGIGRFGMGFFSLLWWLNDNSNITINTFDGTTSYHVIISYQENIYKADIKISNKTNRGTTITLNSKEIKQNMNEINKQLKRFTYYPMLTLNLMENNTIILLNQKK
jgi:hypothetical protein